MSDAGGLPGRAEADEAVGCLRVSAYAQQLLDNGLERSLVTPRHRRLDGTLWKERKWSSRASTPKLKGNGETTIHPGKGISPAIADTMF